MRVWLAPSLYSPNRGGVEEVSGALARKLSAEGFDITVVTNRHPPGLEAFASIDGVDVHRLNFASPARSPAAVKSYVQRSRNIDKELIELPRPDLINVHCVSNQTPPLLRFAKRYRVPIVVSTHGETEMDANHIYQRSRWMRSVYRRAAERAAVLTACSSWTADRAAAFAPQFAGAEILLNGIDANDWRIGPPTPDPIIGAWGRHVPQKGFATLLEAFENVRTKVPDAQLLLGGDGPSCPELRARAGDGVTFLGSLDRAQVKALLNRVRVVAVPSKVEPYGIVALEALAAGRALVYSDVGGLPEATGGAGTGVAPEDIDGWSDALHQALVNPVEFDVGYRRAAELDWSHVIKDWEVLFERVVRA